MFRAMRAVRRRRGLQLTRTSSSQAPVFDRELKLRHRARAAAEDAAGVAYLREAAAARVVGRLRDVAAREEKKTALDLGCGAGHLRAALEADAVDGDVAGGIATLAQCDAAPEAVAACASRAPAAGFATTAVVADEERSLPFDDASFDAVLSSGSLHWVNDLPGALREVRRVLRPDGVFIGALAGAGTLGELQYCRRPARGRGIERRRPGARAAARAQASRRPRRSERAASRRGARPPRASRTAASSSTRPALSSSRSTWSACRSTSATPSCCSTTSSAWASSTRHSRRRRSAATRSSPRPPRTSTCSRRPETRPRSARRSR